MSTNSEEPKFPLAIRNGSAVVTIYKTPNKHRQSYTLSYWFDGKRKRQTFTEFSDAKTEGIRAASRFASGDLNLAKLSSADCASFLRAKQFTDSVSIPLELAAAQFAEAKLALGSTPLSEAVGYYLKKHPKDLQFRLIAQVIPEMLESKRQDGLNPRYLKQLGYDLKKFSKAFNCNITNVTGQAIDSWLRSLGVAARTRNNLRTSVQTLFSYAKSKRYLPKDHDELDAVEMAKSRGGSIEIFTPQEMKEILDYADERIIPFLTLGAFAGIRHAEIQRLNWKDVRFESGIIEIRAENAKTASRRTIPITDNLRAWLLKCQKETGPICTYKNMTNEIKSLVHDINLARRSAWAEATGATQEQLVQTEKQARHDLAEAKAEPRKPKHRGEIPPGAETSKIEGWPAFSWKHNAIRHSFISYRIAEIKNVAQVALEAGNSPQIIHSNYKELVRPADAQRWFSIVPGQAGKIISVRFNSSKQSVNV